MVEALSYYQRGLKIVEDLAASAPENTELAREIAISYWKCASVAEGNEQVEWLYRAHSSLTAMQAQGILATEDEKYLSDVKAMLGLD